MNNFLPSKLNYRVPAEWETHEATWICWPQNKEDWPGKFSPIKWAYGEIVKNISVGEKIRIIIDSKEQKNKAQKVLKSIKHNSSKVEFYILKTDRGWTRDSGPIFIKNRKGVCTVSFKFNGWAKYNNFTKDKKLPKYIVDKFNLQNFIPTLNEHQVVLEGGSIDTNGAGTLITTEECLMSDKIQVRNPGFTKADYEKVFMDYLGIKNTLWLGKGIVGDDTHGHVDDVCRFVNKNTVVIVREGNANDENYVILEENYERLKNMKLEDNSKVEIVELPMPSPIYFKNQRLPASYANFYISNSAVLVPTFNDKNDRIALGILSDLLPERQVIGIHAVDLVWGLGTIHCLTHEQPQSA